jgi:hypothetical protein
MSQSATLQTISATFLVATIGAFQRELSDFDKQMRTDLVDGFFAEQDFFNEPISYEHSAPYSTTESYSGYFEDPTREVAPKSQAKVTVRQPMVQLNRYALKQQPKTSDVIVARGARYTFDFTDDDGTGVLDIYLVREGKQV